MAKIRLDLKDMEKMLEKMKAEAEKRNAPVLRVQKIIGKNRFKLLVFVMLSARTKDNTTLKAVERLFKKLKTPGEIADSSQRTIEGLIYGVGFYKNKALYLKQMAEAIAEKGKIPQTLNGLLKLKGVGRKTAKVFLAHAFNKPVIGVDVHVHRISNRLGLISTKKPIETEAILHKIVPNGLKNRFNQIFVAYGQTVCLPRNPKCDLCFLSQKCPKIGLTNHKGLKTLTSIMKAWEK